MVYSQYEIFRKLVFQPYEESSDEPDDGPEGEGVENDLDEGVQQPEPLAKKQVSGTTGRRKRKTSTKKT